WKWYVPAYFYCGGAAGAAAVLGAAAQLSDRKGLHRLIARARWVAAAGGAVGTALLIADLGRPARFLNMLRVFRPTSPMNLGSWILSSMAPAAAGSALFASPGGLTGAVGDAAGLAAGVAGVPLAGYTAVLVSNTAVPVWQQTRRTLPPLFVSSAVSAGASLLQLMDLTDREAEIVRRFAIAGAVGDLISEQLVERDAGRVERVGRPLHEGRSGMLMKASKVCTAAGLVLTLFSRRSRAIRMAAGVLGSLGALAVKFGISEAGTASAADPRATFHQQRSGLGGQEATGRSAVSSA
ncbi:MAG TPA: NrfD/PsrC family molybdoenzyme membrane anchor subunit, partial [Actinomycetota bacterium]|nr:NrfD/PsrC family molybdoenzyme membrane anchor subunit [Actinomycetota bacterium]